MGNATNQEKIVGAGGMKTLVDLLLSASDAVVLPRALAAMKALVEDNFEAQDALLSAGGMGAILEVMSRSSDHDTLIEVSL